MWPKIIVITVLAVVVLPPIAMTGHAIMCPHKTIRECQEALPQWVLDAFDVWEVVAMVFVVLFLIVMICLFDSW